MDKRITINYLIGTFLITYVTWGIVVIANQIGYFKYGTPISTILWAIGGSAPPVMGYIILKKEYMITGIKQFVKEAFAVKQKPQYYTVLIVFLVVYFGVPALMQGISKGVELYISFLYIPIVILFYGGLEELGWRYVLQPALEKQFPFGIATTITACIWAVWHLPLFFMVGSVQYNWNFGIFIISIFGMSFALAAIYYVSKSIWLCILFHGMANSLSSSWIIKESIEIKICTTSLIIVLSFAIVMYQKKKKDNLMEN